MAAQVQTLDEQIRKENKIVAYWLLNYDEERARYEWERQNILLHMSTGPARVGSEVGMVSDPTGCKVARLSQEWEQVGRWLALVEDVEARLPEKMRLILRLRREARSRRGYTRGRPAWIAYVQHRYCREVAARLKKQEEDVWINSPQTFSEWWDRIINYAAREAARRGLLEK